MSDQIGVRAMEPDDFNAVADLMNQPKVIAGTLRLPLASLEEYRKRLEASREERTSIVAEKAGRVSGVANLARAKGRRAHVASMAVAVHDEFQRQGVGSALIAALINLADNWLNLKRLELSVYTDNEPAVRLYRKYGFVMEGTHRADTYRDGRFVDVFSMGRVRE
ncbi:MAG: GNAT family N-acetyltransferase [Telmatospirillum sp.]|nr:GNAT family N-acetyltransferase [Telmatospirillum sp.]